MKNKSLIVVSSLFIVGVLALGCSQAAASPTIPLSTSTSSSASTPAVPGKDTKPVQALAQEANTSATSPAASTPPTVKTEADLVKISDLLENPKNYDGKVITVQGKIVSECGSGCWFTLQDGNAVIYIDLAPNNLVIPQKKGSNAKVVGKVIKEGSDVYMIGSKVDF